MLVKRVLPAASRRLVTIRDDVPLLEAARLLSVPQTDLVVVSAADGLLAGVVTKTDIVRRIGRCEGHSCAMALAVVMTRAVVTCRPDDWLQDIWASMKERGLKNVPIVDEAARPKGVLNARDALQVLFEEVEDEDGLLRDYVMGVGYR